MIDLSILVCMYLGKRDRRNVKSFQLDYTALSISFQDEEGDFLAKLAKLVNGMGLQLMQCWQK